MRKFARARQRKALGPLEVCEELARGMGGLPGSRDDDDLTHPGRGLQGLEPLTAQAILLPLTLRLDGRDGDGKTHASPTCHSHHHITAASIGGCLTLARHVSQGMLAAPLGLVRRVAQEGQLAIGGGR